MTQLLSLLQIKTVRSAWVFLVGSALMFVFGAYQAVVSSAHALAEARSHFDILFFAVWFFLTGAYVGIASWALYSTEGRAFLVAQENVPVKGNRTVFWYLKFLFACYAAAFATLFLWGILSLPFAGYVGLEAMMSPESGFYFLAAGLVWAPMIFRYLK